MASVSESDLELKVEEAITEINALPERSVWEITKKVGHILWATEVHGGLIRRYQKKLAEGIGWPEKDLTIRHALYWTVIPAVFQTTVASIFDEKFNFGDTATNTFLGYQSLYLAQGILRAGYAQWTKKSIGAIGMIPIIANATYITRDVLEIRLQSQMLGLDTIPFVEEVAYAAHDTFYKCKERLERKLGFSVA